MEMVKGSNLKRKPSSFSYNKTEKVSPSDARRAFLWAQNERETFGFRIRERIRITEPNDYEDPPNATVCFFYDKESGLALRRVNWEDGRLRYDEIVNFNELRFEANSVINHLLYNGVRISNLYTALGI